MLSLQQLGACAHGVPSRVQFPPILRNVDNYKLKVDPLRKSFRLMKGGNYCDPRNFYIVPNQT